MRSQILLLVCFALLSFCAMFFGTGETVWNTDLVDSGSIHDPVPSATPDPSHRFSQPTRTAIPNSASSPESTAAPALQGKLDRQGAILEIGVQDGLHGFLDLNSLLKAAASFTSLELDSKNLGPELGKNRKMYRLHGTPVNTDAQLWVYPEPPGAASAISLRIEIGPPAGEPLLIEEASRYGTSVEIGLRRNARGEPETMEIISYMMADPVTSLENGFDIRDREIPIGSMSTWSFVNKQLTSEKTYLGNRDIYSYPVEETGTQFAAVQFDANQAKAFSQKLLGLLTRAETER